MLIAHWGSTTVDSGSWLLHTERDSGCGSPGCATLGYADSVRRRGVLVGLVVFVALIAGDSASASPAGRSADACPARSYGMVPRTSWAPARTKLVPAGASSVVVCRYNGDNGGVEHPAKPAEVLLGTARFSSEAAVMGLVAQFNELSVDAAVHSCPDENLALLVYVNYRHRVLDIAVDSCLDVSNGRRVTWAFFGHPDGLPLIGYLVRATGGYWPL